MSPGMLAAMRAAEGDAVVQHGACHWRSAYPGFFQPVHLLERVRASAMRQPARLCWGFRAALPEAEAHRANASIPLHILADVRGFDETALCRNRRSDLRRSRRLVEFRQLESPALLFEQGHDVYMSAVRRLGHWPPLGQAAYRERLARRIVHGPRLLIAGLVEGRLRGYLDSYAIDDVLYTDQIFVATDALRTGIGTGLYVETLLAAARDGAIRDVCNSLHRPENPNLGHFKAGLGFRVVQVPARASIRAPMRQYLRTQRPATWYRLTGDRTVLGAFPPDSEAA
ncbi:MAG: hypothetical protein ABFS41_16290 [Myxococcota bacterium]